MSNREFLEFIRQKLKEMERAERKRRLKNNYYYRINNRGRKDE